MFTSVTLIAVFVFFYIFLPSLVSRVFLSFRLPIKTISTDLSQQLIEFYVPNILFLVVMLMATKTDVDWCFVAELFNQKGVQASSLSNHLSPSSDSDAVNYRVLAVAIIFAALWGLALSLLLEKAISDQSKNRFKENKVLSKWEKFLSIIFKFRFPNLLHPWYLVFFAEKKKTTDVKLLMQLDIWTKGGLLFGGQLKDYILKADGDLQCISLENTHKYLLPPEMRKDNTYRDLAKDGEKVPIKGDEFLVLSHDMSNINVRRPKLRDADKSTNSINIKITMEPNNANGAYQEVSKKLTEALKEIVKNAVEHSPKKNNTE